MIFWNGWQGCEPRHNYQKYTDTIFYNLAFLRIFCQILVPFCEKQEIVSHNIKMKLYKFTNSTTSEIIDRTTEFSSKWIITTGMMWENINANYAEEYDSLLKVKNQVTVLVSFYKNYQILPSRRGKGVGFDGTYHPLHTLLRICIAEIQQMEFLSIESLST